MVLTVRVCSRVRPDLHRIVAKVEDTSVLAKLLEKNDQNSPLHAVLAFAFDVRSEFVSIDLGGDPVVKYIPPSLLLDPRLLFCGFV